MTPSKFWGSRCIHTVVWKRTHAHKIAPKVRSYFVAQNLYLR